ncbi:hypothetical protein Tco_0870834 [Tanacetum coccineum]
MRLHGWRECRIHKLNREGSTSKQGNQKPIKLLSPKYQSQSSLEEQNMNPSSLKRVHFINSIILLRKEDEPEEEGIMEPNAAKGDDHSITIKIEEEVKEEIKRQMKKPKEKLMRKRRMT